MSFLTAEWNNLGIINYEVDPAILEKHVPRGTELDFCKGKCNVNFIGFQVTFIFLNSENLIQKRL